MGERMARNNGNADAGPDWNGDVIPPAGIAIVDDANIAIIAQVDAGTLELDPTLGRHYTPSSDTRPVNPIRPVP